MGNDTIKWKFGLQNSTDYIMEFRMFADSKIFNFMFQKARDKLAKDKGITLDADPDKVVSFEIEERYCNLLNTILRKQIKFVISEVGKDGIIIYNQKVEQGKFVKENNTWNIYIKVGGQYGRKV